MKQYLYKAHSLTIVSDLELPELKLATGTPDVEIVFGITQNKEENWSVTGSHFQFSETGYIYDAEGVARFNIKDGKTIIIDRYKGVSDIELRILLLNKIWAVLLTQRKEFTLHACAVLFHKKAYLFTGSQMSTKLFGSYFREEGYTVYSDSISLLRFQPNNQIQIVEGFQNVRYNSSMPINKGKQYLLPVKLDQIINVETMTNEKYDVRVLSKKETFLHLLRNTFHLPIINHLGFGKEAFNYFLELSKHVDMISLSLPESDFSLPAFKNYVLELINDF